MKKRLFITISVVVAAIVVVVVSCKKDDQNALLDKQNQTTSFAPANIFEGTSIKY